MTLSAAVPSFQVGKSASSLSVFEVVHSKTAAMQRHKGAAAIQSRPRSAATKIERPAEGTVRPPSDLITPLSCPQKLS
jgi:hypothetical protein